jgi:HNH endonuclease
MTRLPPALRHYLEERARGVCEYCRSSVEVTGQELTVDYIFPTSRGGRHNPDNLCLSCSWCNIYKQASTEAKDPRTGLLVPLYNPRAQSWEEHFRWSPTATRIVGRTAVGRATLEALRLNRPSLIRSRAVWARFGLHPPRLPEP